MAKPNYKRRSVVINWDQLRYTFHTAAILIAYTVIFAAILLIPPAIQIVRGTDVRIQFDAATQFLAIGQHIWPAAIVSIISVSMISVFFIHNYIGPIKRFEKVLRQMSSGDLLVKLKFRKKDMLNSLADEMNDTLDNLNTAFSTIRDANARVEELVEILSSEIKLKDEEGMTKDLNLISDERRKISEVLSRFSFFKT